MAYNLRDDAGDAGAGNDTLATATSIGFDAQGKGSLTGLKLLAVRGLADGVTVRTAGKGRM